MKSFCCWSFTVWKCDMCTACWRGFYVRFENTFCETLELISDEDTRVGVFLTSHAWAVSSRRSELTKLVFFCSTHRGRRWRCSRDSVGTRLRKETLFALAGNYCSGTSLSVHMSASITQKWHLNRETEHRRRSWGGAGVAEPLTQETMEVVRKKQNECSVLNSSTEMRWELRSRQPAIKLFRWFLRTKADASPI